MQNKYITYHKEIRDKARVGDRIVYLAYDTTRANKPINISFNRPLIINKIVKDDDTFIVKTYEGHQLSIDHRDPIDYFKLIDNNFMSYLPKNKPGNT